MLSKFMILLLFLHCGIVSALSLSKRQLPADCGLPCLVPNNYAECPDGDNRCLCSSSAAITALSTCVNQLCRVESQRLETVTFLINVCAQLGIQVREPPRQPNPTVAQTQPGPRPTNTGAVLPPTTTTVVRPKKKDNGPNVALIASATAAGIAALLIIAVVFYCFKRKRDRARRLEERRLMANRPDADVGASLERADTLKSFVAGKEDVQEKAPSPPAPIKTFGNRGVMKPGYFNSPATPGNRTPSSASNAPLLSNQPRTWENIRGDREKQRNASISGMSADSTAVGSPARGFGHKPFSSWSSDGGEKRQIPGSRSPDGWPGSAVTPVSPFPAPNSPLPALPPKSLQPGVRPLYPPASNSSSSSLRSQPVYGAPVSSTSRSQPPSQVSTPRGHARNLTIDTNVPRSLFTRQAPSATGAPSSSVSIGSYHNHSRNGSASSASASALEPPRSTGGSTYATPYSSQPSRTRGLANNIMPREQPKPYPVTGLSEPKQVPRPNTAATSMTASPMDKSAPLTFTLEGASPAESDDPHRAVYDTFRSRRNSDEEHEDQRMSTAIPESATSTVFLGLGNAVAGRRWGSATANTANGKQRRQSPKSPKSPSDKRTGSSGSRRSGSRPGSSRKSREQAFNEKRRNVTSTGTISSLLDIYGDEQEKNGEFRAAEDAPPMPTTPGSSGTPKTNWFTGIGGGGGTFGGGTVRNMGPPRTPVIPQTPLTPRRAPPRKSIAPEDLWDGGGSGNTPVKRYL